MRAGKFRNLIRIEKTVTTPDATTNEQVISWTKFIDVFAGVKVKRGREFFENGQFFARTLVEFECHFFDLVGVTETMRVKFEGGNYKILGIRQDYERLQTTYLDTELVV